MIKIGMFLPPMEHRSSVEMVEGVLPEKVEPLDSDMLRRCPSITDYYKNTYVVRAPYTLEFEVVRNEDDSYEWQIDMETTTLAFPPHGGADPQASLSFTPDGASVQIRPFPSFSFVSDTKDVVLLQHTNGVTVNSQIISGVIDIYKWPDRALSVAYPIHKGHNTVTIKKGEPWFFLTFITPDLEPVKVVQMDERHPFLEKTKGKENMSKYFKLSWRKQFNYFGRIRPKKLLK